MGRQTLTPLSKNVSGWYNDVVLQSGLADYGPAKGTMVFRPYGFALWEKVQEVFNKAIKKKGVENAYFPLFIPYSLLEKEADHVEGFSPELALVTIGGGKKLQEKLAVRPTSETIIYSMWKKWYQSWRDFPVLMNQWANIVRWEKRTYLFLRTTEFLWQEGHTAHTTEKEAKEMSLWALEEYRKLYEELFAVPGIVGIKSARERFAGAMETYSVELMMPNGKALQGATSHELGQNFSKAFDFTYQDKDGKSAYPWQTSWGLSTRSLGGLILTHGDDKGLRFPPMIAPIQVVIVPIIGDGDSKVTEYVEKIQDVLLKQDVRVKIDERDCSPGVKFNEWELRGVPLRLEVGPKEIVEKTVTWISREDGERGIFNVEDISDQVKQQLSMIQKQMLKRAHKSLMANTTEVNNYDEFKKKMKNSRGFLRAFWCEDKKCEENIKNETKATTRVRLLNEKKETGKCVYCGKKSSYRWNFALAY
ncbi:proline--tRNA ligase [Patescibacteria group bacterium]|nr:proline--tRNA ligase [Patescibacteria group bacterium]